MELGQHLSKLAFSEGKSGQKPGKVGTIVHVGIIQGWIWVKIWQSWHHPRVDLAQNLAMLTLSYMLALSKGGLWPKVVDSRNYRHFQGWIWSSKSAPASQPPQPSKHSNANLNIKTIAKITQVGVTASQGCQITTAGEGFSFFKRNVQNSTE